MQLTSLPRGSGEAELMGLLPIFYVYDYIEQSEQWGKIKEFGNGIFLKRKIEQGKSCFILGQMFKDIKQSLHASDTLAYDDVDDEGDLNVCRC